MLTKMKRMPAALNHAADWCEEHIPGWYLGDLPEEIITGMWELVFCKNKTLAQIYDKLSGIKTAPKHFAILKMILITALIAFILFLIGEDYKPLYVMDDVPFMEFSSYISETGGQAQLAFIFGIMITVGLSTFLANLLQKYVIGQQEGSFFRPSGFIFFIMTTYIISLCGVLIRPMQNWFAENYPGPSQDSIVPPFPTSIFGILGAFALLYTMAETVKTILGVYVSIPCFYIFIWTRLNVLVMYLGLWFDDWAGVEWFDDLIMVQCLALSIFTQICIELLYRFGILRLAIVLMKKIFLTVPWFIVSLGILLSVL